jgi:hypothetical protein
VSCELVGVTWMDADVNNSTIVPCTRGRRTTCWSSRNAHNRTHHPKRIHLYSVADRGKGRVSVVNMHVATVSHDFRQLVRWNACGHGCTIVVHGIQYLHAA